MVMNKMRPLPLDLWTDESLIELPLTVKWTAVGLRQHADDHGRETITDWMLRPSIWPGEQQMTEELLVDHLLQLDEVGYIGLYTVGAKTYYTLRQWPAVSHPAPSKHPAPPPDLFQKFAGSHPDDFSAGERASGREGETSAERPAGIPPSPFCRAHQPAGTTRDCRHCGTARLAHEQWIREQRDTS